MTRDHEVLSFGELLTEEHGFISTVRKSTGSSKRWERICRAGHVRWRRSQRNFSSWCAAGPRHSTLPAQIDYISAVSGGGYACAWLVKWLKSSGDYSHVLESLASPFPRRQSERITWLRDTATTLLPALVLLQRTPSCLPPPTRITSYTT